MHSTAGRLQRIARRPLLLFLTLAWPLSAAAQVPPGIEDSLHDQTSVVGSTVVFEGVVNGSWPLHYQWERDGLPLSDGGRVSGATNTTLVITQVHGGDTGAYRLTVTNEWGSATSSWVRLSVVPVLNWGSPFLGATTVPASATNLVAIDAGWLFDLALRGDGSLASWGLNCCNFPLEATNLTAIAACSGHSLVLREDGRVFAWGDNQYGQSNVPVEATNVVAIAAGADHSLALRGDGTIVGWGNNSEGQASAPAGVRNVLALAAGFDHSLALLQDGSLLAWGHPHAARPPWPISQEKGFVAVAAGYTHCMALRPDGTVAVWGSITNVPDGVVDIVAISADGSLCMALRADGQVFAWGDNNGGQTNVPPAATNAVAIAAGDAVALALMPDPGAPNPPYIARQPMDLTIPVAYPVTLYSTVRGTPPLRYQWRYRGAPLVGQTNSWLALDSVRPAHAGDYQVVVTNTFGVATSRVVTLTVVWPAAISQPPGDRSILLGSNATFTVSATGTEPLHFQWQKDGENLIEGGRLAGTTSTNLDLTGVLTNDAGDYRVVVSNPWSAVTSQVATLTVFRPPTITVDPVSQTALAGTGVTFEAGADGTPPIAYQWWLGGTNLNGATNATLTLANLQPSDAGDYALIATSPWGSATSAVATLTVVLPVSITASPGHQTVPVGTNVAFTVETSGTEPFSYQWRKDGADLSDDGRISGATSSSLNIAGVQARDAGGYRAVVRNAWSETTSEVAVLTVFEPLVVTNEPVGQIVVAGTNVTFAVGVAGTPPLTYQWRLGGTNLSGATSPTLTLTNVQSANAGDYDVVVSHPWGTATSAAATLTVTPSRPWFLAEPRSRVASVGQDVSWEVTARGTEPLSYQWQRNGTNLPGATASSFTLPTVHGADAGNFRVVVGNEIEAVPSAEAMLSVVPVVAWGFTNYGLTAIPAEATNVVALAAGGSPSGTPCLALRTDGTLVRWGYSAKDPPTPAETTNLVAVTIGNNPRQNDSMPHHLALRADGTLFAWGSSRYGQTNVPPNATNAVAIAAGGEHCLALRGDGTVVAWGANRAGQANVPASASNVVAVAAGTDHSLALRFDGSVVTWGSSWGPLTNVPASATNVVAISAGGGKSLVLRADGVVVGWGAVTVPPIATNLVAISAGYYDSLGLRPDGTVLAWGANPSAPFPPAYLAYADLIAAGVNSSLARVTDPTQPVLPRFGREPMDQSVTMGQTLLLQCLALGSGPLSYQWQFGDTELPNQTNRWLSVTNVQLDRAGPYRVVVSSDFGSATSAVANVTVTWPSPQISGVRMDTDRFSVSFYALRGADYVVDYRERVENGPWLELARRAGMDSEVTVTDPVSSGRSRFYRVRVEPGSR